MKYVRFLNCLIDLSKWNFAPRLETEFWVKKAIKYAEKRSRHIKLLDMFAGTGCIGIAILKNVKNSRVDFADINEEAIGQIKVNLKLNKINPGRYEIYRSDLFEKIKGDYHFIFANPPYVARDRINEVQPTVLKYEPPAALFGGKKGLFFINKFLKQAKNFLEKQGVIFLEFSPEQKEEIKKILAKNNYKKCRFFRDQFKKYRCLKCS